MTTLTDAYLAHIAAHPELPDDMAEEAALLAMRAFAGEG